MLLRHNYFHFGTRQYNEATIIKKKRRIKVYANQTHAFTVQQHRVTILSPSTSKKNPSLSHFNPCVYLMSTQQKILIIALLRPFFRFLLFNFMSMLPFLAFKKYTHSHFRVFKVQIMIFPDARLKLLKWFSEASKETSNK